jgi:hypothetical protein
MAGNKRISSSRSRSAKDLANEGKPIASRLTAEARARQLANEVHRLEVEIVASQRLAREHRARNVNILPAPERSGRPRGFASLTHAQKRSRRHRFYLQGAQFLVTTCLVAGAGAWLYKLWLSLQ